MLKRGHPYSQDTLSSPKLARLEGVHCRSKVVSDLHFYLQHLISWLCSSIRVWRDGGTCDVLQAHKPAVWAVAGLYEVDCSRRILSGEGGRGGGEEGNVCGPPASYVGGGWAVWGGQLQAWAVVTGVQRGCY